MRLLLDGPAVLAAGTLPVEGTYSLRYSNQGPGAALDVTLALAVPASGQAIETDPTGAPTADGAGWAIGSVSGPFAPAGDPPSQGSGWARLRFDALGEYLLSARLDYRVGVTELQIGPVELRVRVAADRDADGVIDDDDPFPDDPNRCGDSDADTCDDCALGPPADPLNDGPDRDGDGMDDTRDRCPDEPETFNAVADDDGCPDSAAIEVRGNQILVSSGFAIYFATGSDQILPESQPVIDALVTVLTNRDFGWIRKLRIDGHTDDVGEDAFNDDLSMKRARAVVAALVARGVPPAKLEARGWGERRPVIRATTEEARAVNRRVEMFVTDPPVFGGARRR